MLKREWGADSNGKLPHLFIPSKTLTLVPEFAVEDLPLGRISLVPEVAVEDLHLGKTASFVPEFAVNGWCGKWSFRYCFPWEFLSRDTFHKAHIGSRRIMLLIFKGKITNNA